MANTVNVVRFSADVGISRPTFYKYRREGMPVDSPEAARAWIAARKASDQRGGNRGARPVGGALLELREQLMRANLAKVEAEGRLKAFEVEQAQKNLVSMDVARGYLAEVLAPLRALLDALPQSCAARANPADPTLAEEAVRESLDSVFKAMDAQREAPENVS